MKKFKIRLEDKAALLNRLESLDFPLNTSQIKNNKLEGYFVIETDNPEEIKVIQACLRKSPKINIINENTMKSTMTKAQLKEMIREEYKKVLFERKKLNENEYEEEGQMNEVDPFTAGAIGVSLVAALIAFFQKRENKAALAKELGKRVEDLTPDEIKKAAQRAANSLQSQTGR